MINETLVSFKDLLKSKARNPFFGSLAIVWVIHNWDLVYSFFHFGKDFSRQERLDYFDGYFTEPGFLGNMFVCVLITFAVLIGSYALTNIARFIKNVFKDIVSPWICALTDDFAIVPRSKYEIEVDDKEKWRSRFENEQNRRFQLLREYDELEEKYNTDLGTKEVPVNIENEEFDELEDLHEGLVSENLIELFTDIIGEVNNGTPIDRTSRSVKELTKRDLIKFKRTALVANMAYYTLTSRGRKLADYLLSIRNNG